MPIELRRPVPPHLPRFQARLEAMLMQEVRRMRRRRWRLPRLRLWRRLRTVAPAALHGGLALVVAALLVVPFRSPAGSLDQTATSVGEQAPAEETVLNVAAAEFPDPRPGDFTRPVTASPPVTPTYVRARPA